MKFFAPAKALIILFVLALVSGCASTTLYTAPELSDKMAIQYSDDDLSGWFDLPGGVYQVPDSQVIISGHQSTSFLGSLFGPLGLALESSINAESGETATQTDSELLHIKLNALAREITDKQLSEADFADTFTDTAIPGVPVLQVKTAVVMTFQDDENIKPYVLLQAALKDPKTNTDRWKSRYIASSGPARPFEGDDGWSAYYGQKLNNNIYQNLKKAISTMLTDIATPYPRRSNDLITIEGHFPYVRDKLQTVAYQLDDTEDTLVFLPRLSNAVVFSGVHVMEKATIDVRPAMPGDEVYKIIEPAPEPDTQSEPETETESQALPETQAEGEPETAPEPEPVSEPDTLPELDTVSEPAAEPDTETLPVPETQTDSAPEEEADSTSQQPSSPETEMEPAPDSAAEAEPESTTASE
jgi:hypothetical protein